MMCDDAYAAIRAGSDYLVIGRPIMEVHNPGRFSVLLMLLLGNYKCQILF